MKRFLFGLLGLAALSAMGADPNRFSNITVIGTATATTFAGSGSGLVSIPAHAVLTHGGYSTNFSTLPLAATNSQAGDTIDLYGSHTITGPIILTNLTVIGHGATIVWNYTTAQVAGIVPYDRCTIRGITFTNAGGTGKSVLLGTISAQSQLAVTNLLVQDCDFYGDNDAFMFNHTSPCSATLENVHFYTQTDPVVITGPHMVQMKNFAMDLTSDGVLCRGILITGGASAGSTNLFQNGRITLASTVAANQCAVSIGTGAGGSSSRFLAVLFENRSANTGIRFIDAPGTTVGQVITIGCIFRNYGDASTLAWLSASTTARWDVQACDLFNSGGAVTAISSINTKGSVYDWDGKLSPANAPTGYAKTVHGSSWWNTLTSTNASFGNITNTGSFRLDGAGTADNFTITNLLDVLANLNYKTNVLVPGVPAINMALAEQEYPTNADFTLSALINVPTDKFATTVCYVTNSAGGTTKAITPVTSWHVQGTWNVTNLSSVSIDLVPFKWTNAICNPIF